MRTRVTLAALAVILRVAGTIAAWATGIAQPSGGIEAGLRVLLHLANPGTALGSDDLNAVVYWIVAGLLILGDGTAVQFSGKCETGVDIERRRPSRVERQMRAELVDLGHQPLFDVVGVVVDQHGIAQESGQTFMTLVPVSRIGCRAHSNFVPLDSG